MRMTLTHPLHVADTDGVSPTTATYESLSTSASFTTAGHYLGAAWGFSCTFSTPDAAADGAVKLQGCNDPARVDTERADGGLVNWFDVPFVDATGTPVTSQTVAGASVIVFDKWPCSFRWMRLVYTRNSGTAAVTARVQIKGIS